MVRSRLVPVAVASAVAALSLVGSLAVSPAAVASTSVPAPVREAPSSVAAGSSSLAALATTDAYTPTLATGQPLPAVVTPLPAIVDPIVEYQGQRACSPAAKPGAVKLAELLRTTFGAADIWIDRDCADGGQSEHKEGRALDWMLSYNTPAEREKVEAFLWWVAQPDPVTGEPAAMARRLGIMYMGWHDRIWRGYSMGQGWSELKGCYSTPDPSYDTYCHRDHLHISLTWESAAGRTSFWDGSAETLVSCPRPSTAAALGAPLASSVTPITAWTAVSTRSGLGTAVPCRFIGDRWSGDGRAVRVPVLGRNGVPATGVAAVQVRLAVTAVNAPTSVVASATASTATASWVIDTVTMRNSVTVAQNATASALVIAPVAADGTIALVNRFGSIDLRAVVTGWVASASTTTTPPPPTTTTTPPPPTTTTTPPPPTTTTTRSVPAYRVPLRLGVRSSAVTAVQRGLLKRGYAIPSLAKAGATYGYYDRYTVAAVKKYQLRNPKIGRVTGVVTAAWYRSITAVLVVKPRVSLAAVLAHQPAAVKIVQAGLNKVVGAGLTVDGQWGTRTQAAYDTFRIRIMGLSGSHAPGPTSLATLGARAGFTVVA